MNSCEFISLIGPTLKSDRRAEKIRVMTESES